MKNLISFITLTLLTITQLYAQHDIDGARPTGSNSSGVNLSFYYNTNIQLIAHTHSASHGILFNSYKPTSGVTGSLGTIGNTKHAHDVGAYSGGAGAIMFFANGGTMDFRISDVSTGADTNVNWGTPVLRLKRGGNVGIGVGDPSDKLEVNGTIRSKEVKVESTGWPDYVFKEEYLLPSLKETESYIKENQHLPGIPSAQEVKEEGISLGEMNAKLLEKIEELTLYVIELKKHNERLEDRVTQLENEK